MSIAVIKRPYDRNWSGNPIHYTLYSATAEADPTHWFEFRILFKRMDEADYSEIITLKVVPVTGTAKIDIQDILDGLLEYELPIPASSNEYTSPYLAKKATGQFYIEFRELEPEDTDTDWDSTEEDHELFVIKGGISFHKWRGDNYWVNYFDVTKPFLTWQQPSCLHSLLERMYLSWLNNTDIPESEIQMKRTVMFTDGSTNVEYLNCPVSKYYIVHFPSGGKQLELESIDTSKTIYYWELQVFHVATNPEEPLSEPFRYYADNRNDYNAVTLNYRNSLGGIDSVRVRGVIDYTNERKFDQVEKVVLHDYFSEHFINGRIGSDNSSEVQVYKGDAGFVGKEEQDRLRDFHHRRECWWEQQNKWLPVFVLTSSNRLKLSNDKLFAFPVEFCIAAGEENYYTPNSINLAEAATVVSSPCNAVIGSLTSNYIPGTGWVISWVLVSGAPGKYFVYTPGVSGGAPGETITTSYTYPWLPVGDNVITVRPVCLIGGVWYLGAPQTITVTVEAACVGVGISGAPISLSDAVEGLAYYFVINLTGTAPFSIDNITKPAWMNIAVVGSTVEITGTPSGGDVGTDIDVSFDLHNCSGANDESYADTIDVLASGLYGDFILDNQLVDPQYAFIKKVMPDSPPFYSFTSGGLPVMNGETAFGFLTDAISTAISVELVSTGAYSLSLYKNGVLQETIVALGSGIYTFAAVAYLVTDDMEIRLTL